MIISTRLFRHFGPQQNKFSQGITALQLLPSGNLLLGIGEGKVIEVTGAPHFKKVRAVKVPGPVSSVVLTGSSGSQVSHTASTLHAVVAVFMYMYVYSYLYCCFFFAVLRWHDDRPNVPL